MAVQEAEPVTHDRLRREHATVGGSYIQELFAVLKRMCEDAESSGHHGYTTLDVEWRDGVPVNYEFAPVTKRTLRKR